MTIAEWIRRCAIRHAKSLACVDGARRFTYAEFNERVNRQANGLSAMGLKKGDRVAVLLNNGVEAIEAVAAAAKGGFVHVPVNFRSVPREIANVLQHSGSTVVLVDAEYKGRLDQANLPDVRTVVVKPGQPDSPYEKWLAGQSGAEPTTDVTGDDDFMICYTSGATGTPKGVLHKHRQSVAHAPVVIVQYEIDAASKLLLVYPHNSIASINMFYVPAWLVGSALVTTDQRHFDAERWLSLVERERITHCHLVPTMLFRVLESPKLATTDCSSLRTIGYGSAPMPTERVERLMQVFGNILIQGYGMTEVSSIAAVLDKADHLAAMKGDRDRLNSCGRPAFGTELRVVDDNGRDVAPGEVGEIIFRGPQVMSGYWNEPEKTAETIREGWLYSGDMARVDAGGYLYIVDRKKDLIISGGANISSREVEEVLYWHPSVREASVIGRPDEQWGELPHAFVSLLPDKPAPTPAELIAFCKQRLANYKCPQQIEIIADLPKSAMGKILKTELRAKFWEGMKKKVN
ncbi:long-chain-fatty-acid--CoA ligase [Bradyrhizobium lablabi]|uniref:class I adenylate-forming enzyme family protein n=1 Tax=Bradyrhizobium lablabi TaxID=722472 RepID=UPI001BABCBEE|nr:long-chain-fatty-acid--CoA ligase [Bradyrhizobium lablabi]MBR1125682.1 long-chain-fatty-acid--CoA ligase [Bradyrhizobium lablabi]